jgi:hypothetical protein
MILIFLIVCLLAFCSQTLTINLGAVAGECAKSFCSDKDGLLLWLDIQPYCHPVRSSNKSVSRKLSSQNGWTVDKTFAGIFCSIMAIIGLLVGSTWNNWKFQREHDDLYRNGYEPINSVDVEDDDSVNPRSVGSFKTSEGHFVQELRRLK